MQDKISEGTVIETHDLTRVFGSYTAVDRLNLTVRCASIFGFIGSNGSGKSTAIRMICGLLPPTHGTALVLGCDTAVHPERVKQSIGYMSQRFSLYENLTVWENMMFYGGLYGLAKEERRCRCADVLAQMQLVEKRDVLAGGLSGGQKQRVGIARALAGDPKVLLCDEATSALDPQTTKSILALIRDINRRLGLTVVVITHEMQVIKDICDRVAVLDGGVIAEEGDVVDVFTEPQQAITKEFISVLLSNDLPTAFRGNPIEAAPTPGSYMLLRLTFLGENADDPVLADMIRLFPDIEVTMLFGTLDQMKDQPFGRMIIGLRGETAEIDAAISYLSAQHLKQEVIGYVRRNDAPAD